MTAPACSSRGGPGRGARRAFDQATRGYAWLHEAKRGRSRALTAATDMTFHVRNATALGAPMSHHSHVVSVTGAARGYRVKP